MTKDDALTTLFRHNRWANGRLLERCATLTPEQLDATIIGTFGTIRDTLSHVVRAERGYLALITGQQVAAPKDAAELTLVDLAALSASTGAALVEWASRVRPDDTVELEWYGTLRQVPKTIILTQAITHATEHRVQVLAILTQLGIEPPDLGGWMYMDEMEENG